MMPRAVIFDLDGTLADTISLIVSSWNAAVEPFVGRRYSQDEVIARFGPTEAEMLRRELPAEHHDAAIERFHRSYREDHAKLACVFAGVTELLSTLSKARIPMGVMTGKGREVADVTLAAFGWSELFASVVTGDEIARPKPDPQGVLLVAQQLEIDPKHCVYIGDAPADISAGKAAGMIAIWAGWHPIYADQIRALNPDYIAKSPGDVLRLIDPPRR
jgi:pyrophosphatase PpaX